MHNYNSIKTKLQNKGITCYLVEVSPNILTDSIWFFNYDEFESFMESNTIKDAFICEIYLNVENYIITKDVMRTVHVNQHSLDYLSDVIEQYNTDLVETDFDYPEQIFVVLVWNGQRFCYIFQNNITVNGLPLLDAEEKLLELIEENQEGIIADQKQKIANCKDELATLKEDILNDPEFRNCTNMRLRRNYMYSLFDENCRYHLLCEVWTRGKGILSGDAFDFIEQLWREQKKIGL